MQQRRIGTASVPALGLGCMNLSHAYGTPPSEEAAAALLLRALEHGITHFDTAALYGFGRNETLLGKVLKPHRQKIFLASKCGMTRVDGKRVIDGRPETLQRTCEESLRRLQTDVIDLYYLHRWDKKVPIEDSVGALADLVRQWTRNADIATLAACRELGTAFVAFSPVARAFLTGTLLDPATELEEKDIRRQMPRFEPANYAKNLELLPEYRRIAAAAGCTPAQLAIAWLLARGDHILPIFGTRRPEHLDENAGAAAVRLEADLVARLDALISTRTVAGPRYNAATQSEIDTETFPWDDDT